MSDECHCKSKVPAVVTYLMTTGGIIVIYLLFTYPIPDDNKSMIYTLLGSCTTVYLACMSYWFGNTHSSNKKDDMLYKSTPPDGQPKPLKEENV